MRLLASVISAYEAEVVATFADVIDVKNPADGPLGAPDPATVFEVKKLAGLAKPLSVALGDATADIENKVCLAEKMVSGGADILKLAVSDLSPKQGVAILKALRLAVSASVKIVAVAYADDGSASITPFDLPDISAQAKVDGILIDTRYKNGGSVFDSMTLVQLADIMDRAKKLGLMTALAGSLRFEDIKSAALVGPDFIGFRSAITNGGVRSKEGVDGVKVRQIREEILRQCMVSTRQ